MIIILVGAPGAGKGTQSDILRERLGMLHISSGDLLRDNVKRGTELGKIATKYMVDEGSLVPDDLIIDMITNRLALPDAESGYYWMASHVQFPRQRLSIMRLSLRARW